MKRALSVGLFRGYESTFNMIPHISLAMDYGGNEDVQKALCDYIVRNDYNPAICDYIKSQNWIEND